MSPSIATKQEITFILPTRNRRDFVVRALESCLEVSRPGIHIEVLVIDGNSSDGSWEMLNERYKDDSRVRIIRQQDSVGFMSACFLALDSIRTEFSTFMYDDDILSPHWYRLAEARRQSASGFVMGFGRVNDVHSILNFREPDRVFALQGSDLLRSFARVGWSFPPHGLPYSPISCFTRTSTLMLWRDEVRRWSSSSPFREHWMMHRNAGPDLMIYLHSCMLERSTIPVLDGVLAQWSAHPDSMTIRFEADDIMLGYWLAKAWMCDALVNEESFALAGACAAGVIKEGERLLRDRMRRKCLDWGADLAQEIETLRRRIRNSPASRSFCRTRLIQLLPRSIRTKILSRRVSMSV